VASQEFKINNIYRIDPKYLAGIMDSDGSFSISKHNIKRKKCSYTTMIQLTWSYNEKTKLFMDSMVSQYGGSYFIGFPSGKAQFPNTGEIIKYCAIGVACEKISKDVVEFLLLKNKQCENILSARDIVKSFRGLARSVENEELLERLFLDNKALNTKNGSKNK